MNKEFLAEFERLQKQYNKAIREYNIKISPLIDIAIDSGDYEIYEKCTGTYCESDWKYYEDIIVTGNGIYLTYNNFGNTCGCTNQTSVFISSDNLIKDRK